MKWKFLYSIVLLSLISWGCSLSSEVKPSVALEAQTEGQDFVKQRIDSVIAHLGPDVFYLVTGDSTKLVWEDSDFSDEEANFLVYNSVTNTLDSAKAYRNVYVQNLLPSENDSIIYYLSCGGSGRYCDIIEFNINTLKEGATVVSDIWLTEWVERIPEGFRAKCYKPIWGDPWYEEYDFRGHRINQPSKEEIRIKEDYQE